MSFQPFLNAISAEIEQTKYGHEPVELYEPIEYIMSLGGKRLRPLLAVLTTNMFSGDWQATIKPALAIEVFHNFTLMHDDIMDDAPLRRGKATVHEKWNANIAILSGDVMLVKAYDLLLNVDATLLPRVLRRFNRTATEVCEGQQLDMNFEGRQDVSEAEYINMIRLKTSVLLGFSLELGGILAGVEENITQKLYDAGVNMGLGFQLKDDLLDVYGDPEKFGKQVGGDIISNKKTFLLINALAQAKGQDAEALNYWLSATDFDKNEKVKAVTELFTNLNIRQLTENKIDDYFKNGFAILEQLKVPASKKKPLMDFAEYLVGRES